MDNFDACYLPDGRIVFASTASFTGVPCWHGKERACSLYLMDADGSGVRQLCFDQDLDLHPSVLPTGQVIYSRWDYTGIMHIYLRPLMVMNPDGTRQRAVYGSNSYYPNSLYFPPRRSRDAEQDRGHPVRLPRRRTGWASWWLSDTGQGLARGRRDRPADRRTAASRPSRSSATTWSATRGPSSCIPIPLSDKYFLVGGPARAEGALGHLPGRRVRQHGAAGEWTPVRLLRADSGQADAPSRRSSPTGST